MTDYRKLMFIHKNPHDPADIVTRAINYGSNAIAYCLLNGTKTMNLKAGFDVWFPKILKNAKGKLAVFAYHQLDNTDHAKQAKKMLSRIKDYSGQLAGVMVYAKPLTYRVKQADAETYMKALRAGYTGRIDVVIHDADLKADGVQGLCKHADNIWLILSTGNSASLWQSFANSWLWLKATYKKNVYPVLGICNIPAIGYKVNTKTTQDFWTAFMAEKDIHSSGLWNWNSEDADVICINQDGSEAARLRNLITGMKWTKVKNTAPVVINPPPVIDEPVIVPPIDTTPEPVIVPETKGLPVVIDIWEGNENIDLHRFNDNGVVGCVVRLNDMNGGHHMDKAFSNLWEKAKIFPARTIYFVYNPWVDGAANWKFLKENKPADMPKRFSVDVEVKYPNYSAKTYGEQVSVFIDLARKAGYEPFIYTGQWFLEYLTKWRKDVDYWWARYPYSMMPVYQTWDEYHAVFDNSKWSADPLAKCPGTVKLWQCADSWKLPGSSPHPIDINLWNGTVAELIAWIGGKQPKWYENMTLDEIITVLKAHPDWQPESKG